MSLQKLASVRRALAGRNIVSPGVNSSVTPVRQRSNLLALPPREKVSNTELIILSAITGCSVLAIPAWVIFHMKEYTEPIRNAQ